MSQFAAGRAASASPGAGLEEALRARIERVSARIADLRASVVFDAGAAGRFTLRFDRGRALLERGAIRRPSVTLFADPDTMLAVIEGRSVGVDAFLRGRLLMRGNIGLALELDDLVHPTTRDVRAPRVHRLEAAGVRTFLLEAGPADAPPVVLLHGLGATSASFLPSIWDLSADHRILALDLPGFGESDKPLRPLRPAFFARHVVSVLDALGLPRAHVIGNSMGGRVAIEVALRHPDRADRLVLLAPSMAWRRFRSAVWLVRLLRHELAAIPLPVLHRGVVAVLRSMFAVPSRVPDAAMNAAADEFLRIFATRRGRIAFFNAMREIYLEDPHGRRGFWDRLPGLDRPALFLFGDRDWLVPPGFARHVGAAIPGARCEVLERCGHVPQYELPDATHARIRAFLREQA